MLSIFVSMGSWLVIRILFFFFRCISISIIDLCPRIVTHSQSFLVFSPVTPATCSSRVTRSLDLFHSKYLRDIYCSNFLILAATSFIIFLWQLWWIKHIYNNCCLNLILFCFWVVYEWDKRYVLPRAMYDVNNVKFWLSHIPWAGGSFYSKDVLDK